MTPVGLVGGVGGAYVGGVVSNNGQEQQFENQRASELQDVRIDAYASYLRANSRWAVNPDSELLRADALAAETQVEYESVDPDVDDAAMHLFEVVEKQARGYEAARQSFIEAAEGSLDQ